MVPVAGITGAESGLGTAGGLMGKVRLSPDQSAAVAANIRTLRLARRWPQRRIADLMEWGHNSVTYRAEGRGNGTRTQRIFTRSEVERLAGIFGVRSEQLTTRTCAHCHGVPPTGFACLSCGAKG
jgi:hypothetical protein